MRSWAPGVSSPRRGSRRRSSCPCAGSTPPAARPADLSDPVALAERAARNLADCGALEPLLADDDVWEIMINAPGAIFVKRDGGASNYHDEVFDDDDDVVRTLTKILDDAS